MAAMHINFYKEQIFISEEMYEKHKKDDLLLLADEALKYNIVDAILTEI